jgi:hypothetical protein
MKDDVRNDRAAQIASIAPTSAPSERVTLTTINVDVLTDEQAAAVTAAGEYLWS